jgi:hypothetical protein
MEAENMTSPLLKMALSGLSLDLEQELKRYSHVQEAALPEQLTRVNQDPDFITGLIPNSIVDQTSKPSEIDIDAQDWELSYLLDDLAGDLSTDLENSLDEEFQDQIQTREFVQTAVTVADPNSEETVPNLLSPMGIIAMMILLVTSAAVGYLLVDPSGLNRLIKQDPNFKPKSQLPSGSKTVTELFQTSTKDRKESIPFVDFSISKPSAQRLSKILSPLLPPIDNGRSFEPPIRVLPEEKEPVASENPKPNPPKPPDAEKTDINSKLEIEPTLSSPEITPNSDLNTPSTPSQVSTPNSGVSNVLLDATRPNPTGELMDATKPVPNSSPNSSIDPQVKPEVPQEVN